MTFVKTAEPSGDYGFSKDILRNPLWLQKEAKLARGVVAA